MWEKIKTALTRFDNLQVNNFSEKDTSERQPGKPLDEAAG
jgi:hypothetical protein